MTKNPVWEISSEEAGALAKAAGNVAKHYPKLAGHEKLIDWAMLIQTIGVTYGTRIYLSMPEKKPEPKQPPANVSQFPTVPGFSPAV